MTETTLCQTCGVDISYQGEKAAEDIFPHKCAETTLAVDALKLLWPFLADEKGQMVLPAYASAIMAAAQALGKKCQLHHREDGYYYVAEIGE